MVSSSVYENYLFSRQHCWLRLEGEVAVVGISDYAQQELGDIIYVDLPAAGERHEAGSACATIESVKTASDVYCPVAGVVQEINQTMQDTPDVINSSPYEQGWLFKLVPENSKELESLLSATEYMQSLTTSESG